MLPRFLTLRALLGQLGLVQLVAIDIVTRKLFKPNRVLQMVAVERKFESQKASTTT